MGGVGIGESVVAVARAVEVTKADRDGIGADGGEGGGGDGDDGWR